MHYFKVSCEFYVQAESKDEAEGMIQEQDDFIERHVMIEETDQETAEREGVDNR